MQKAQLIASLEKFGLSEMQAKIYLLLSQEGILRIQDIVRQTYIPRSSVYEHLKILEEKGLIERIIDEKSVRIKAYPIGSLKHSLQETVFSAQKLLEELPTLENIFHSLPKKSPFPSTSVRYYKNISGARQIFWNSLNAKSTVYVYSEYGRPKYVGQKFYMDFVRESKVRNIQEKVLINPTKRVKELLKVYLGKPNTRTKPQDMQVISEEDILIKGETFIYDNIYAQVYIYTGEINGFEIESKSFAQMQKAIFETLWKSAKPLKTILG